MSHVRIALGLVLELLFPRTPEVAQFDALQVDALTRHMRDTISVAGARDCFAPFSYKTPIVRDAIHAAKFYQHERSAMLLGEALAECVAEELAERHAFGTFFAPIVVPIPLHIDRLKERGFNQAERIAQSFARHVADVHLPCLGNALVRTRHTHSQTHLPRDERLTNVENAFVVLKPALVQGRDVVLIDDVVTTGATMHAGRQALMQAGANDVICVAVAH